MLFVSFTSFITLHFVNALQHSLSDLARDQFSLRENLLKEAVMCPCQMLHKTLVFLPVKTSVWNLSKRIMLIQKIFFFFFCGVFFSEDGAPASRWGSKQLTSTVASSLPVCHDSILSYSVQQRGVTGIDLALPTPTSLKDLGPFERH